MTTFKRTPAEEQTGQSNLQRIVMNGTAQLKQAVSVRFLKRHWVVFVLAVLLLFVVGSLLIMDVFAGGPTASFEAGYDYGMEHSPAASQLSATTSAAARARSQATTSQSTTSQSTATVFERCASAARFETPSSDNQTQWRTGCISGWNKKNARPTADTEGATTMTM